MRKTINVVGWVTVLITIIALILTILTMYQFMYVKYFNSYFTLQWCIILTMTIWGIKLMDFKTNMKSYLYSSVFLAIAAGTAFFMVMKVY